MLEDDIRHQHPSEVDIESLQTFTRVWLDRGASRDEEASLHKRHMDMSLTTCNNQVMQWPESSVCALIVMCGHRRVHVMHRRQ